MAARPRVVVACVDRAESELVCEWLSPDHDPFPTRQLQGAVQQVQSRQAHLVVADARLAFDPSFLSTCRGAATPTPLVVLGETSPTLEAAAQRHGAFYIVRPLERDVLLCHVAMGLVDARPVRRSPRYPVGRLEATADGVPVSLLDVANEGLRLEVPKGGRAALPPFFTVRVPLIGLSVGVQRVWVSAPEPKTNAQAWCGGALVGNSARQEQKWRNFVSIVPRTSSAVAHT